jgi:uncharacterized membrane protein YjjB (DUF3815 family)
MSTSDNSDLMAMAISFAWFAAAAWVTLGSDIISKIFKTDPNSFKFHIIAVIVMSILIYKYYKIIQVETDARAAEKI